MKVDLTGKRYGKLTVTGATDQRKNGYTVWRCRCDCGNEVLVDYRKFKRGTANDCGCDSVKARRDLRGQRFGKLLVVRETDYSGPGGRYWFCRCDCGGTIEAPTRQLVSGCRRSCGCLSKPALKDYQGKQFGDLTVLNYAGKRNGIHYWHCRCACGREIDVQQTNLQNGHTKGCGCKNDIRDHVHFVDGTNVERIRSTVLPKTNTSGVKGVHYSPRQGKWIAQITFRGKKHHIGSFNTLPEAARARQEAEEETFGKFLTWYDDQESVNKAL